VSSQIAVARAARARRRHGALVDAAVRAAAELGGPGPLAEGLGVLAVGVASTRPGLAVRLLRGPTPCAATRRHRGAGERGGRPGGCRDGLARALGDRFGPAWRSAGADDLPDLHAGVGDSGPTAG
jgi:hypothetical protein